MWEIKRDPFLIEFSITTITNIKIKEIIFIMNRNPSLNKMKLDDFVTANAENGECFLGWGSFS